MATILIAEDDYSMCQFLGTALQRAGHNVSLAYDGLDAMAQIDAKNYDLLLTDIIMPGMDGIELSRVAAKKQPAMKVMFITGFAAMAIDKAGPTIQNSKIMAKPFHLGDLVKQVEAMLKGN